MSQQATSTPPSCTRAVIAVLALTLWAGRGWANDSAVSEISHVFSGAAIAATATVVADRYGLENRAWVGFGTSVGISFVIEAVQILTTGKEQVSGSSLDFAANAIGSALGAWVSDRYFLAPVVTRDIEGRRVVGMHLRMAF